MCSHCLVKGKLRVVMKRKIAKKPGCIRKVLQVSVLNKEEKVTKYQEKIDVT